MIPAPEPCSDQPASGGACETVVERKTGKFFDEQTWEALADAVVRFKAEDFNPIEIKNYAERSGARLIAAEKMLVTPRRLTLRHPAWL